MYRLLVSKRNQYLKNCRDIFGVWIDIANNIKLNKQASTRVKLM